MASPEFAPQKLAAATMAEPEEESSNVYVMVIAKKVRRSPRLIAPAAAPAGTSAAAHTRLARWNQIASMDFSPARPTLTRVHKGARVAQEAR